MKSKNIIKWLNLLLLMFFINPQASNESLIQVDDFWVVLPPAASSGTVAYGRLKNTGKEADTLLSVSSDSGMVMLHKTEIKSGMAKMLHMENMVIEPNDELVLKPMSYHLMLMKIKDSVREKGNQITFVFEFKKAGKVQVQAPVKSSWD